MTCDYSGSSLIGGYARHRRRGEQPCERCMANQATYYREKRERDGRDHRLHLITCEFCGETKRATKKSARACSLSCAAKIQHGWSTSRELAVYVPPPRPRRTPSPRRPPPGDRLFIAGRCQRCGDPFVIADQLEARYCSLQCSRADSKDRRRALLRGALVEPVYRRRIFERDRWRCQLCGKPVDRRRSAPHPRAATIDHIVPLADGGTHEPANVQCAHFLCNAIKGHRGPASDQLRLVG